MMIELLTTRQVQTLLKVDRITIYRMLQDGRLKGIKIGQQWRFHENEVQRLLASEIPTDTPPAPTPPFPVHCLQTVQNLFSRVSQIGSILVDLDGEAITSPTNSCSLCEMMQASPSGTQACRACWKDMAANSAAGGRQFTCHVGLTYLSAPVMDGDSPSGWLLVGQVQLSTPNLKDQAALAAELSQQHALPVSAVIECLRQVPVIPPERHAQLHSWVIDAATAMGSILQERAGFLQRMRQIADLTQVD